MIQRGLTQKETQRKLSVECKALRDLVSKLRQEMLLCKDETQKVKDQLQCLIYLVRRAWSGDAIASIHVANIVGVAPPTIQNNVERKKIAGSPMSHAVNNWARLCVGVLNKMYREEELELRASQLMYLQDCEGYLDDQRSDHGDVKKHQATMALLKSSTFQLLQAKEEEEMKQRQERIERLNKQKLQLQEQHRRQHPPHSHLYQKPCRDAVQQQQELHLDDALFVKPVSRRNLASAVQKNQQLHELSDFSDELEEEHGPKENAAPFAEKLHGGSRISDNLLVKSRPNTASTASRPVSGTRSRPLSAHLTKPKTTKPLSAFSTSRTRRQLDLIEKDLRSTTTSLQDRLGISREGMV